MGTLARRRLTGAAGAMLLFAALFSVVALPALAHTPVVSAGCTGLNVNLTYYNTRGDNSVIVTIDGVVVANDPDFGSSYAQSFAWSESENHTYSVVIQAWDDPMGSKGWSRSIEGSWQACKPPTTTQPPTTTSTVPEPTTTSTTQPPTTTSTVPEPTTTTTRDRETTTTEMTTTTTLAPTTTQTVPEVSVAGIQIEAPVAAQVTQATLPFTGVSTTSMAVIAAGLAAMGLFLLAVSRQSEEKNPVRSWN